MHDHRHAAHGKHGAHGNPEDLVAYVARLTGPDRDAWQRPDEVLAALDVREGQVVADVGAGPGYFTVRLARAVGPRGRPSSGRIRSPLGRPGAAAGSVR